MGGRTGRPAEHADSAASSSGPLEQRAQLKPATHVRMPCERRGEIEMQFQDVLGWAAAAPTLLAFMQLPPKGIATDTLVADDKLLGRFELSKSSRLTS